MLEKLNFPFEVKALEESGTFEACWPCTAI
jgi:hypothetical protein